MNEQQLRAHVATIEAELAAHPAKAGKWREDRLREVEASRGVIERMVAARRARAELN